MQPVQPVTASPPRPNARVMLAFFTFIVLSFPEGLLGIAWPSIRASFSLPLDALGTLLLAITAGHILSSFSSGAIVERVGIGPYLLVGNLVRGAAWLGFFLSPGWWGVVAAGFVAGAGAGAIDVGLNAFFAANHSPRLMNWLHACFGVGLTLGPVAMTAVLTQAYSWRWGYVLALGLQLVAMALYGLTLNWWRLTDDAAIVTEVAAGPSHAPPGSALRLGVVWLSMLLFFLVAGAEASAGNWAYSLFTEARAISLKTAGLWVGIYWGSFTFGRVIFGLFANRLPVVLMLRVNLLLATLGAFFLWLNALDLLSFLGLALIGFALAPIFPLLVSETPRRVGRNLAARAIGFQIGGEIGRAHV